MALITKTLLVTAKGVGKIPKITLEDGTVIKPTMLEESDAIDIGNHLYIMIDPVKDTQHKINVFSGHRHHYSFWLPNENITWSEVSKPT